MSPPLCLGVVASGVPLSGPCLGLSRPFYLTVSWPFMPVAKLCAEIRLFSSYVYRTTVKRTVKENGRNLKANSYAQSIVGRSATNCAERSARLYARNTRRAGR